MLVMKAKKFVRVLSVVLAMMVFFASAASANDDALKRVLNNETPLFSTAHDRTMTFEELRALGGREGPYWETADCRFAVLDMDRDGESEVVVDMGDRIVLHCEGDVVYAYTFEIREMQQIRKDGSYEGSNGANSGAYLRIKAFRGKTYEEETLGEYDDGTYKIAGELVRKDEFNWITLVEKVVLLDFSPENIEAALSGGFPDAVLISPKEEGHCPLYSAPGGNVLEYAALEVSNAYFADANPVITQNNHTRWYKIVYVWASWDSMLRQVNKWPEFDQNFVYVRADDVTVSPVEDRVKKEIDWLRAGRPPRQKVGDVFAFGEGDGVDKRVLIGLKAQATLLEEPRADARKIEVPRGGKYLGPILHDESNFPVCHADMEEENWAMMYDAGTGLALGWIKPDQLYNSETFEWIQPEE